MTTINLPDELRELALAQSKHADYQSLHPTVAALFGDDVPPARGRHEAQRWAVMQAVTPPAGQRVWDIGANTGYFSMAAIGAGAAHVTAQEGNIAHARFIALCGRALGLAERLRPVAGYCTFASDAPMPAKVDITLCLNVLHHLGDDFGDPALSQDAALHAMTDALNHLASHTRHLWLQLGFNWKGDIHHPLFAGGTKAALLDYVTQAAALHWHAPDIWLYDPASGQFAPPTSATMARLDSLGEFLNRPLIHLRSRHG